MNNYVPAFPEVYQNVDGSLQYFPGMSLRDYFASKAMQGILMTEDHRALDVIANEAYLAADAMMKKRDSTYELP